jgi:hypothetical protein
MELIGIVRVQFVVIINGGLLAIDKDAEVDLSCARQGRYLCQLTKTGGAPSTPQNPTDDDQFVPRSSMATLSNTKRENIASSTKVHHKTASEL